MTKFKPQFKRLLFIDRQIRERCYPNCTALAEEWEVSPKTIQRDIDYMKYELDAPIAYDSVKHGFYYTEARFTLPAINITESDLFAVVIAERVMKQFKNTPLHGKLAAVFARIQNSLPDSTTVNAAWLGDRIAVFPEPVTRINPAVWDTLAGAIRGNLRVRIRHGGSVAGAHAGERVVDPYYLVGHKGEWYLSGLCHTRQSIRTFAVSRIRQATVMSETFKMPGEMTLNRMYGDCFGIIWKPDFYKVRIRFTPKVAALIRERQWHPSQVIKSLGSGGMILEFTTNHLNEVLDWILSWGPEAKILSPPRLVERARSSLQASLRQYG